MIVRMRVVSSDESDLSSENESEDSDEKKEEKMTGNSKEEKEIEELFNSVSQRGGAGCLVRLLGKPLHCDIRLSSVF